MIVQRDRGSESAPIANASDRFPSPCFITQTNTHTLTHTHTQSPYRMRRDKEFAWVVCLLIQMIYGIVRQRARNIGTRIETRPVRRQKQQQQQQQQQQKQIILKKKMKERKKEKT